MEFIWALGAFAGVVLLGTLQGIVVAIVISLIALSSQEANPPLHVLGRKPGTNLFRPRSDEHPEDESFAGLLLLRPEGRIFFANAEARPRGEKMRPLIADAKPKVVALDLSGVFDLEYTALKMLTDAEPLCELGQSRRAVFPLGAGGGVTRSLEGTSGSLGNSRSHLTGGPGTSSFSPPCLRSRRLSHPPGPSSPCP